MGLQQHRQQVIKAGTVGSKGTREVSWTEWDCEGERLGGLRTDAKEMMGTRHRHSETQEAEGRSLGHVWFIQGETANRKRSVRLGSQEGDAGNRRHGGETRDHRMVLRAKEVDRR